MECAALFTVAAARKLRAGCVLHVIWNQEREAAGLDNKPDYDTISAAKAAANAIGLLIEQDGA